MHFLIKMKESFRNEMLILDQDTVELGMTSSGISEKTTMTIESQEIESSIRRIHRLSFQKSCQSLLNHYKK